MGKAVPTSVTERLERLESDNRRSKRTRDTILIAMTAVFFMGHGTAATNPVVGDQIALQAPGGLVRGEMSVGGDGSARFVLYDPSRTPRLELLSTPPDGAPALTLYDKDGGRARRCASTTTARHVWSSTAGTARQSGRRSKPVAMAVTAHPPAACSTATISM